VLVLKGSLFCELKPACKLNCLELMVYLFDFKEGLGVCVLLEEEERVEIVE